MASARSAPTSRSASASSTSGVRAIRIALLRRMLMGNRAAASASSVRRSEYTTMSAWQRSKPSSLPAADFLHSRETRGSRCDCCPGLLAIFQYAQGEGSPLKGGCDRRNSRCSLHVWRGAVCFDCGVQSNRQRPRPRSTKALCRAKSCSWQADVAQCSSAQRISLTRGAVLAATGIK